VARWGADGELSPAKGQDEELKANHHPTKGQDEELKANDQTNKRRRNYIVINQAQKPTLLLLCK